MLENGGVSIFFTFSLPPSQESLHEDSHIRDTALEAGRK